MKLSKKLENFRTDRPSEWMMDEYMRDAAAMENIITELCNCLEPTYSGSPEGNAYLKMARKTLDT
jgi:hypothetical protein